MQPERSWAVGLNQLDFEREFIKRNPGADVIPDAIQWVEWEEPENRLIDAPDAETFEPDGEVPASKGAPIKQRLAHICIGCGRAFDFKIAKAGHERGCKEAIKKKLDAKAAIMTT